MTTHRQTPVHAKVHGNKNIILGKDVAVASLCPALDARMPVAHELGVEESVEGVHRWRVVALPALHQHVHVEVNHLQQQQLMLVNTSNAGMYVCRGMYTTLTTDFVHVSRCNRTLAYFVIKSHTSW